jgi:hypothetical protein
LPKTCNRSKRVKISVIMKKGVDNREMVWYYSEAPYRKGAAAERGIRAREAAWDLEN